MFRKDANIPKSIAFLFFCSNQLTMITSRYLGIHLKQCVQDKQMTNYPTEK